MRARFRVGHCHVADPVDREGVVKGAVLAQDAAVSVAGVLAQADVCDDEEVWEVAAKESDGLDDRTLWVVGCCAESVFCAVRGGYAEENYGAEAFGDEGFKVGEKTIEPAAMLRR